MFVGTVARRAAAWRRHCQMTRLEYRREGRARAREQDPLHMAGCMLYWAEGSKSRNQVQFANSDLNMVRFFCDFLRTSLEVRREDMTLRLNVYTDNGLTLREIEDYWLEALGLPRAALRRHTLNRPPTSSSGKKADRLPYGVCSIRLLKSTCLVQHIYGAIQEYAGFDEPRWLDGPPSRKTKQPPSSPGEAFKAYARRPNGSKAIFRGR
jgi:hypothetical protein